MKTKLMPTTYFVVLLLLSLAAGFVFPEGKVIYSPYTYSGIIMIIFGIIMNLWTDALFKKSKTTVKPHETPTSLETSGPFRISRHPMYLGMTAILLGASVFTGSLITFIFPVIFIVLMEKIFIPLEEKNLEDAFGGKYIGYKKKVRRWI
jgi:protein-S-isoprenylcysteine O-methyltransferase Ste14